ncbi:MAG: DNA replication/repair protein RecF [Oscillospiraceae bacterium]|nr:DNA replication/repair protein RecF [Oscillospiraceae bacterium]
MKIDRFYADGYKNLCEAELEPDSRMNIICGDNAQGKTNLIEAIWLMTGCRSFRGTRERDFIGFTKEKAEINLKFTDCTRQQEIGFSVKKGNLKDRTVTLNGVKVPLLSRLFGNLKCVVFTPEDLALAKGSPDNRRSFVDLSASQLKKSFVHALNKYDRLLGQRNAALKEISFGRKSAADLDIWDAQLAKTGAYISVIRNTYCNNLNKYTESLYSKITDSKENMNLYYQSTIYKDKLLDGCTDHEGELTEIYYERLKGHRVDDVRAGYTVLGVHRDDIIATINGLAAREFGSQGQQRSAALVMKIAQAKIIGDQTGETPVMLLDDVLSELDMGRQRFIMQNIEDMQIFITCCDNRVLKAVGGKIFEVNLGKVRIGKK